MLNLTTPSPTLSVLHLRLVGEEESPTYDAEPVTARAPSFAMIPRAVIEMKDGYASGVYVALASFANAQQECWPSIATLCDLTGWSDRHVRNVLVKLQTAGVIAIERRFSGGMKSSSLYRLVGNIPENKIGTQYQTFGTPCRQDRYQVPVGSVPGTDKLDPIELDPIELEVPPVVPQKKVEKRATQLPEGFDLSVERLAYATGKGMAEPRARMAFEKFTNYWRGEGRAKKDWDATWRNWVLSDLERGAVSSNGRHAAPVDPYHKPDGSYTVAGLKAMARGESLEQNRGDESVIDPRFRVVERERE